MRSSNTNVGADGTAASLIKSGEFRARLITALCLGPLTLGLILAGYPYTLFLTAAATTAVFHEWIRLTRQRWLWRLSGLLFLGGAMGGLNIILMLNTHLFITLLLMVWATDIGAYFSGRLLKGPKLAPRISPGKTWSGALGGSLAGIAVGFIAVQCSDVFNYAFTSVPWPALLFFCILVIILAQLGDLLESWAKRRLNVKNSGALLPGHGGVLDRLDSLFLLGWAGFCYMIYNMITAHH